MYNLYIKRIAMMNFNDNELIIYIYIYLYKEREKKIFRRFRNKEMIFL